MNNTKKKIIVMSMLSSILLLTQNSFGQETPRALSGGGSYVGSQPAYRSSNSAEDFEYAPGSFTQEHISGFWKGGYPNTSFNATRGAAAPAVAPRRPQPHNPNIRDANHRTTTPAIERPSFYRANE